MDWFWIRLCGEKPLAIKKLQGVAVMKKGHLAKDWFSSPQS